MDNAKDKIESEAAKKGVEVLEGSGPAYDDEVPSQEMHQDRNLWLLLTLSTQLR